MVAFKADTHVLSYELCATVLSKLITRLAISFQEKITFNRLFSVVQFLLRIWFTNYRFLGLRLFDISLREKSFLILVNK